MNAYESAVNKLHEEFPDAVIENKAESKFMKACDIALKIITLWRMKTFMTTFTTTIGSTIYVPVGWTSRPVKGRAITIRHETIHIRQKQKYGFLFFIRYLCWPLPAVYAMGRLHIEQEAYEETLRAYTEMDGERMLEDKWLRDHIIDQFMSPNYFWTYPFKDKLDEWYDGIVEKIRSELFSN